MQSDARVKARKDRPVYSPINGATGVIWSVKADGNLIVSLDSPTLTVELRENEVEKD